jgi:hypothetical protein
VQWSTVCENVWYTLFKLNLFGVSGSAFAKMSPLAFDLGFRVWDLGFCLGFS